MGVGVSRVSQSQGSISSTGGTWNSRVQEVTWSSSQKSSEEERHSAEITREAKVVQKKDVNWSSQREKEQSKRWSRKCQGERESIGISWEFERKFHCS